MSSERFVKRRYDTKRELLRALENCSASALISKENVGIEVYYMFHDKDVDIGIGVCLPNHGIEPSIFEFEDAGQIVVGYDRNIELLQREGLRAVASLELGSLVYEIFSRENGEAIIIAELSVGVLSRNGDYFELLDAEDIIVKWDRTDKYLRVTLEGDKVRTILLQ